MRELSSSDAEHRAENWDEKAKGDDCEQEMRKIAEAIRELESQVAALELVLHIRTE